MNSKYPCKWRYFQSDIILLCVMCYLNYLLIYRNLEEMMLERGLKVEHTTVYQWVQMYTPKLDKRCQVYLRPTNNLWLLDESYIKVKCRWKYLYRVLDSEINTLEFLLGAKWDSRATERFFLKALKTTHKTIHRESLTLTKMRLSLKLSMRNARSREHNRFKVELTKRMLVSALREVTGSRVKV